jgi:hypothetical protein
MDDTRVHDALHELAGAAPEAPALWDRTRQRITRRRQRRIGATALAVVGVLAIGTGVVSAVTTHSDDDGGRISAGPSVVADAPDEILAVVGGKLTVLSTADGSVRGELAALPGAVSQVSSVPSGPWITYTQLDARTEPCSASPALVQADADGSDAHVIVGGGIGASPIVSPDGRWVAYRKSECQSAIGTVGITSLGTAQNFLVSLSGRASGAGEGPMAFTPDSSRLLITDGDAYALVSVPDGSERETVDLPQTSPIAAFISEHEVAATRYRGLTTDSVVAIDLQSGEERPLFEVPGRQITSLTYDAPSDTLMAVAISLDGATNGVIVTYDAQGVHRGPEIAGLSSAAWYAPTVTAPASTTTSVVPETTTSTTAAAATTTTAPFTGSTVPPPTGVAGFTDYRTVGLETLDAAYLAEAESPQAKVDELVAFLRAEPIEGRKGAEGAVNSIQGNRAQVEVRVLGVASDSHAGFDYRLYLLQETPGARWKVVAAEQRDLCSRGYDGSVCV